MSRAERHIARMPVVVVGEHGSSAAGRWPGVDEAGNPVVEARRSSAVAIGEVRYEWTSRVVDRLRTALLGSALQLGLDIPFDVRTWQLELNVSKAPADVGPTVTAAVAVHRGVTLPPTSPSADGHGSWALDGAFPLPPLAADELA